MCDGTTSSASHQGALLIELNFNELKVEISFTSESGKFLSNVLVNWH